MHELPKLTAEEKKTFKDFEAVFSTLGMTAEECMDLIRDEKLPELKKLAAEYAGEQLLRRGYFNGDAQSTVSCDQESNTCLVQVKVTCYGLPERIE